MLSKIKTLAAALHLGQFTLEAASARAGVPLESARTAVNRCREGWFVISKSAPDGPGGRTNVYTLTDAGRAGIAAELGRLPELPPVAPIPDWGGEPVALKKAQADLRRYASSPPEGLAMLRQRVAANLDSAERVLRGSAPPANTAQHLKQLAQLREQLAALGGDASAEREVAAVAELAVAEAPVQAALEEAPALVLADAQEELATMQAAHHPASAAQFVRPGGRGRVLRPKPLMVLVGAMSSDQDSRYLAVYVKGVLDLATRFVQGAGIPISLQVDLVKEQEDFMARSEELLTTLRSADSTRPFPRLFMCMNSSTDRALESTLARIRLLPHLAGGIALADSGSDRKVAAFAKECSYAYKPHANPEISDWINGVVTQQYRVDNRAVPQLR
jgi:hypothetical protein